MSLSRRLARPMISAMFVQGGVDALRNPEAKAPKAATVAPAVARALGLPEDTVALVRFNGAVQVAAGLMLATGRLPRLASGVLAISLVPTTLAGHRFWEETDKQSKAQQQVQFMKNLSMLGGLILAATDTDGRPSLSWRAHRVAHQAGARALEVLPIGD